MLSIEFEHIGKQYRLGRVGTGTLAHDLNRFWQMKVMRREDPYLRVGESNAPAQKGGSDYVWALKDISFSVEQGEVVGIIGRNGAGKSTLLKLLSNITAPTTGRISYQGRVASLLEVGTGFHPELTGRENIFMNGAILGMSRKEIAQKLDAIVDFAGVERYLDTPVKRYSSGMTVRLGFAVAAFLEPDILVVDEVLAVGDAEFQKKAIGKIRDVAEGEGRTVLFVSHNMGAVSSLCTRGIVLDQGRIRYDGGVAEAIGYYSSMNVTDAKRKIVDGVAWTSSYLTVEQILLNGTDLAQSTITEDQRTLELMISGTTTETLPDLDVRLEFRNKMGVPLMALAEGHYRGKTQTFAPGHYKIEKKIKLPRYLAMGDYVIDIVLHQPNVCLYMQAPACAMIHVDGGMEGFGQPLIGDRDGIIGLESFD